MLSFGDGFGLIWFVFPLLPRGANAFHQKFSAEERNWKEPFKSLQRSASTPTFNSQIHMADAKSQIYVRIIPNAFLISHKLIWHRLRTQRRRETMRFKREIMMEPSCITLKLSSMTSKTTFSLGIQYLQEFLFSYLLITFHIQQSICCICDEGWLSEGSRRCEQVLRNSAELGKGIWFSYVLFDCLSAYFSVRALVDALRRCSAWAIWQKQRRPIRRVWSTSLTMNSLRRVFQT